MFWESIWLLGLFEYGSGSQICTNLQTFLFIWSSFLKRFITFKMLKWLFSKIYTEIHWKAEMFLPWILFVKFWVPKHGSRLKKCQFLISPKFSTGRFSETIRYTELKSSGISCLIDQAPGPGFIKIWERHPSGKIFKNWSWNDPESPNLSLI